MAKRSDGSRCHLTWRYYVLGRPRLRPHIVLDGDPAALPKRGHSSPHFSAHVYRGQTAGWMRMPIGTQIGLVPGGDIVLDGDPAAP